MRNGRFLALAFSDANPYVSGSTHMAAREFHQCRICLVRITHKRRDVSDFPVSCSQDEQTDLDGLIAPCYCRGSQQFVHRRCLVRSFAAISELADEQLVCRTSGERPIRMAARSRIARSAGLNSSWSSTPRPDRLVSWSAHRCIQLVRRTTSVVCFCLALALVCIEQQGRV